MTRVARCLVPRAIKFNGGGHVNHSIFWTNLAPPSKGGGGEPTGKVGELIQQQWGSFEVRGAGSRCRARTPRTTQCAPLHALVRATPCTSSHATFPAGLQEGLQRPHSRGAGLRLGVAGAEQGVRQADHRHLRQPGPPQHDRPRASAWHRRLGARLLPAGAKHLQLQPHPCLLPSPLSRTAPTIPLPHSTRTSAPTT